MQSINRCMAPEKSFSATSVEVPLGGFSVLRIHQRNHSDSHPEVLVLPLVQSGLKIIHCQTLLKVGPEAKFLLQLIVEAVEIGRRLHLDFLPTGGVYQCLQ